MSRCADDAGWDGDPDAIVIDDELGGRHVFVVDGSRLYELDPSTADHMAQAVAERARPARRCRGWGSPVIRSSTIDRSSRRRCVRVSLAVAQKCNLGCTYCYAQQGDFGMESRLMSLDEATARDRPAARRRRCRAIASPSRSWAASRSSTVSWSAPPPSTP